MIFGFSLYAVPLLVTLFVYFRIVLGNLVGRKLLESSKVYYHQHWRRVLVLVNFQDKLVQCKLLDYILGRISRVAI